MVRKIAAASAKRLIQPRTWRVEVSRRPHSSAPRPAASTSTTPSAGPTSSVAFVATMNTPPRSCLSDPGSISPGSVDIGMANSWRSPPELTLDIARSCSVRASAPSKRRNPSASSPLSCFTHRWPPTSAIAAIRGVALTSRPFPHGGNGLPCVRALQDLRLLKQLDARFALDAAPLHGVP
jgi:hypothetical protein